jgi:hypothetical protein
VDKLRQMDTLFVVADVDVLRSEKESQGQTATSDAGAPASKTGSFDRGPLGSWLKLGLKDRVAIQLNRSIPQLRQISLYAVYEVTKAPPQLGYSPKSDEG